MSNDKLSQLKTQLAPILKDDGVGFAAIFGSRARGENKPDSDLDLLVRFNQPKTFFEIYDLEQKLAQRTGLKVDLVSERAIKKHLLPFIQRDMRAIL